MLLYYLKHVAVIITFSILVLYFLNDKANYDIDIRKNETQIAQEKIINVYELYEIDGKYDNMNNFIKSGTNKIKYTNGNITYNLNNINDVKIIIIYKKQIKYF